MFKPQQCTPIVCWISRCWQIPIMSLTAVVGLFWRGVKILGTLFKFCPMQKSCQKVTWPFDNLFALVKIQTMCLIFWSPHKIVPPQEWLKHSGFLFCRVMWTLSHSQSGPTLSHPGNCCPLVLLSYRINYSYSTAICINHWTLTFLIFCSHMKTFCSQTNIC